MKKVVYLTIAAILFCCSVSEIRAEKLKIGLKFPVDKLSSEKKSADNTIIVFIPSLTYECEYASMLTQSFYYYFEQKLAFEGLRKSPATQIFLIVGDTPDYPKSKQNIFGGMRILFDEEGKLFSLFNVRKPLDKNADSTVVLLDSTNKIVHIDESYRAQGEHLKPLENKLKRLNGISTKVKILTISKALKVGDAAPNFRVGESTMLSDLRGSVVLISFYPAAFSGRIPRRAEPLSGGFQIDGASGSECVFQIGSLEEASKSPAAEAKRLVVSSSTKSLLQKWRELLETQNVEYVNDADYSISAKYFSYNPKGYNNRVSVVVDQHGKIALIDEGFEEGDEAIFNRKIAELLEQNK